MLETLGAYLALNKTENFRGVGGLEEGYPSPV